MTTPSRRVLFRHSVVDLVEYLMNQTSGRVTLLVCSTRERFLEQLWRCYDPARQQAPSTNLDHTGPYEHENNDEQPRNDHTHLRNHALISKTVGLLAKSSRIRVIFCPTLEHARAFLATLHIRGAMHGAQAEERHDHHRSLLAVIDILECHRRTAEFSAQGISRSLALLVEAAFRTDMDVVLGECEDGETRWDTNVPILSSSIRIGGDNGPFSGRGVSVQRIAERWFDFGDAPV